MRKWCSVTRIYIVKSYQVSHANQNENIYIVLSAIYLKRQAYESFGLHVNYTQTNSKISTHYGIYIYNLLFLKFNFKAYRKTVAYEINFLKSWLN